mgnify:CR=1 FL=1
MKQLNSKDILGILESIKGLMRENKDWLIKLDAQNGDGDLGLSMDSGFSKTYNAMRNIEEKDLGRFMLNVSRTFNEAAPSTMGTLLSIGFMGIAKHLKGKTEASLADLTDGMKKGIDAIMEKGGAKPGEKTIIDSLYPAMLALKKASEANKRMLESFEDAEKAAYEGMLKTKEMKSVHGRAAYYKDTSIGVQDGGATVGMLMVRGTLNYIRKIEN